MEKKTECEVVQDLLFSYVDGVLSESSKKLVEKHLVECTNCQQKLKEIKSDIKENDTTEEKEIDYLKKIRKKSKMKSIGFAILIILIIFLIIYVVKFIVFNSFISKAEKLLQTNNFYKEIMSTTDENGTPLLKEYYKDGKSRQTFQLYTNDGVKNVYTKYTSVNSDEIVTINEAAKKVYIDKNEENILYNQQSNFKIVPFISSFSGSFLAKLSVAFVMSIDIDTYEVGREYYVIRNQFDKNNRWEIWIDKETGLPIKEINRSSVKSYYAGTSVIKSRGDYISEMKYEFDTVTDEDVNIPDLSGYSIEYRNININ